MNPIFVFLVVLGAALLWLICSFVYRPIGRFFYRLWHDAKEVTAQQKLELAKIEAETALINANKDKEVAEIEAEKILIAAEAEAQANVKIANSLSEALIQREKLEKWNGILPQIVSDGTIIKDFSPSEE